MQDKKVLVNKPIHEAALERLQQEVQVLTPYSASYQELMDVLPEVNGIILCAGFKMGPAEMDRAAKLEVISRHGAGVDIVDVPAADERSIPVTFTPYGPTESTAEHALMLMLATARRLPQLDRAVRTGNFHIRDKVVGQELEGKALGVVGFGRIGRRLAEMCRDGLHMQVYVYDPYVTTEKAAQWGATQIGDLVKMAGMVDVLSIHSPATDETRQIISQEVITALKPTSILVNTSRGALVDETALIHALQEGKLAGAGLDVYDPEPPSPNNPLFNLEQVALTPHLASFTDEGRKRMGLMAVEDLLRVLRDEEPHHLANPGVWANRRIQS
ncbi:MAG: hydroxyacid dehydrogenase [Anaerolineales bacterium]|nr:hydroxyacid dehydrogenase [Anaerolineales bacterium]